MTIKVGDRVPAGSFGIMNNDGPGSMTSDNLFKGKRVVLFSVPGAFTPTCSKTHLPGFVQNASALKAKGIDTVACLSVNDVFVMDAWGKSAGADGKVLMLADGNATYTKALGLGRVPVRKHQNLAVCTGAFAPGIHHENVVYRQAGHSVDPFGFQRGSVLHESRERGLRARRRE